jgi:hypothetical protein
MTTCIVPWLVVFNTDAEPTEAERASWPRFYVPAGGIPSLLDDARVYRILTSGEPCIGLFERREEGEAVVAAFKQARRRRMH